MKRAVAFLLAALLMFSLFACGTAQEQQPSTEATEAKSAAPKSLKILAIGNSFSEDAMKFLYQVMEAEGVEEIVLGNLFVGGCTLSQHAGYMTNNTPKYRYDKCSDGTWTQTPETTLLTGIQDENWDVITLQQGSTESGLPDKFQPYLNDLAAYVEENKTNSAAKLYWHMTWAYQEGSDHPAFPTYGNSQQTMYYGILNAVQKAVEPSGKFQGIIPSGTAIQNMRGSVIGDALTRDGYHLNTLGRVTASYTWYAVLAGVKLDSVKVSVVDKLTLTDTQKDLIVKAVNAAVDKPYIATGVY